MMKTKSLFLRAVFAGTLVSTIGLLSPRAFAHCDTMDGPVVVSARTALQTRDITPVLKWVKKEAEAEIKAAFAKSLAVRTQGPAARELADQFFFETLVRVHRAGEGAPFTGLKPAGTALDPGVEAADKALATGSLDQLTKLVTHKAVEGIRHRFSEAREKQAGAEQNVEAGREFVAAYVEYVHYIEGLHQATQGNPHFEGQDEEARGSAAHQEHAGAHEE